MDAGRRRESRRAQKVRHEDREKEVRRRRTRGRVEVIGVVLECLAPWRGQLVNFTTATEPSQAPPLVLQSLVSTAGSAVQCYRAMAPRVLSIAL